jgi:hypothetical protein
MEQRQTPSSVGTWSKFKMAVTKLIRIACYTWHVKVFYSSTKPEVVRTSTVHDTLSWFQRLYPYFQGRPTMQQRYTPRSVCTWPKCPIRNTLIYKYVVAVMILRVMHSSYSVFNSTSESAVMVDVGTSVGITFLCHIRPKLQLLLVWLPSSWISTICPRNLVSDFVPLFRASLETCT